MPKVGAPQVEAALQAGPFRSPAHAWLSQVRNQTGYARSERYADGLAVSLWPSRGIWFAGVEIKVDRRDWLRELDDPAKSAEVQRFCNYWWIAAPAGVVEIAEVPESWGFIEVTGKKCKTIKDAPKLTPEPLTAAFVASVLRNVSTAEATIKERILADIEAKRREEPDPVHDLSKKLFDAELERDAHKRNAEWKDRDLKRLTDRIADFERAAGLPENTVLSARSDRTGELYATALALAKFPPASIASALREAAESMDTLASIHAQQERRG